MVLRRRWGEEKEGRGWNKKMQRAGGAKDYCADTVVSTRTARADLVGGSEECVL